MESTMDNVMRDLSPHKGVTETAGIQKAVSASPARIAIVESLLNTKQDDIPDLCDVLDELSATFTQFLSLEPGAADTAALWVVFSHTHKLHEHSPRLLAWSPLPGSGKSV